jgi:hypothetical protein
MQQAGVMQGSNQLRIDIGKLPNEMYIVETEWDYGRIKKVNRVVKH